MPSAWVPQDGTTRRVISAITAALLALTLIVILPVAASNTADAKGGDIEVSKSADIIDITEDTSVVFTVTIKIWLFSKKLSIIHSGKMLYCWLLNISTGRKSIHRPDAD